MPRGSIRIQYCKRALHLGQKPRIVGPRGTNVICLETLTCRWHVNVLEMNVCSCFPMACATETGFESNPTTTGGSNLECVDRALGTQHSSPPEVHLDFAYICAAHLDEGFH